MNVLVLSPHRDDAAFSLATAIENWLAAGHRVTVLGVFTRSLHAPFSDADTVHANDLLSYVSAMRRREDAELLKLIPALRMVDLNLKDAPLRLRCAPDELYTLAASPEDTAVAKIGKALARLDAEQTIDAVLLPLGLGHHVDHLVVRDAALGFAATRAYAFYEELPDALRSGSAYDVERDIDPAVHAELAVINQACAPILTLAGAGATKRKLRIVSVYASQIDEATMAMVSHFADRYQGGERLWPNPAFQAALSS